MTGPMRMHRFLCRIRWPRSIPAARSNTPTLPRVEASVFKATRASWRWAACWMCPAGWSRADRSPTGMGEVFRFGLETTHCSTWWWEDISRLAVLWLDTRVQRELRLHCRHQQSRWVEPPRIRTLCCCNPAFSAPADSASLHSKDLEQTSRLLEGVKPLPPQSSSRRAL